MSSNPSTDLVPLRFLGSTTKRPGQSSSVDSLEATSTFSLPGIKLGYLCFKTCMDPRNRLEKSNGLIRLKKKLKLLKVAIKEWSKEARFRSREKKSSILKKLSESDKLIDQGDENTKYFHGILKKRRSQLAIRGTLVNGEWISSPDAVKHEFLSHFRNQNRSFQNVPSLALNFAFPSSYLSIGRSDLERSVSYDEVKSAIWDCGSVLVNGSPSSEFQFLKGLKQGDPISPFLFILIMESLHLSFTRVINAGLFKGIKINPSFYFSHLFYADDAVFVGDWNVSNIKSVVKVLKCFHLASGLKINLHKSKLMGVGINSNEVSKVANSIGCSTFSTPFKYLGVSIGDNMSCISAWDDIISKVSNRLSKWKLKMLSIGWPSSLKVFPRALLSSCHYGKSECFCSRMLSSQWLPEEGWKSNKVSHLCNRLKDVVLPDSNDRWTWTLEGSGLFTVKSVRRMIDNTLLPSVGAPTRWVKIVPIKVNILAWRLCLDKIPTRLNLSIKELIFIHSYVLVADSGVESTSHIFFSCSLARQFKSKVMRWWEMEDTPMNGYEEWLSWLIMSRLPKNVKTFLEGIFYIMWWLIWRFRNQLLFGPNPPRRETLFDDVVQLSYLWCSSRCNSKLNWVEWLKSPNCISL
ncbi:RNA-directed DNA polymerase, eukaryota [Tanacetum coccineum]